MMDISDAVSKLSATQLARTSYTTNSSTQSLESKADEVNAQIKHLRTTAFATLFSHLNGPLKKHAIKSPALGTLPQLYGVVFSMRCRRQFDTANKLEGLIDKLVNDNMRDEQLAVLTFLLMLHDDTSYSHKSSSDGQSLPILYPDKTSGNILPAGGLCYGDTRRLQQTRLQYMLYPRHVFDPSLDNSYLSTTKKILPLNVFSQTPGKGLQFTQFFNANAVFDDRITHHEGLVGGIRQHHHHTSHTLFGSLVHSSVDSVDITLNLPELTHPTDTQWLQDCTMRAKSWKKQAITQGTINTYNTNINPSAHTHITTTSTHSQLTEDEGFRDASSSTSDASSSSLTTPGYSCCSEAVDSGVDTAEEGEQREVVAVQRCAWQGLHKTPLCNRFVWEYVGRHCPPVERPLLTESGSAGLDNFYLHWQHILTLIVRAKEETQNNVTATCNTTLRCISHYQLSVDVIHLLVGIPSRTFSYTNNSFSISPHTHITGITPHTLASITNELMMCGNTYRHLVALTHQHHSTDGTHLGSVRHAFNVALSRYLLTYAHCVLQLPPTISLLQIKHIMKKLMQQMKCLRTLVQPRSDSQQLPQGIALLSRVYGAAVESSTTPHYAMMLALLRTTAAPYLHFLHRWVYEGVCVDPHGEFNIRPDIGFLGHRDRQYWKQGYTLTSLKQGPDTAVSDDAVVRADAVSDDAVRTDAVSHTCHDDNQDFLVNLTASVFSCGKSLNLLRLITNDNHFLFGWYPLNEPPPIDITTSSAALDDVDTRCRSYHSQMKEIARQANESHRDRIQRQAQHQHHLRVRARQHAEEYLRVYEARQRELMKAVDAKKREEFARLKKQRDEDLARRAQEETQSKEDDAKLAENFHRQELLEAHIEQEQHEKARQELVAHYEMLMRTATLRERKALWRVQRMRLDERRMQHMQQEQQLLQQQMLNQHQREQQSDADQTDGSTIEDEATMSLVVLPAATKAVYDPERSPDALPAWARSSHANHPTSTLHVADPDPNADVPVWARQSITAPPFGLDYFASHTLPGWAQRGIKTDNMISVDEFAEQAADIAEALNMYNDNAESTYRPAVKHVSGHNVWDETRADSEGVVACIQSVAGHHVTQQTTGDDDNIQGDTLSRTTKSVEDKHVSQQTDSQQKPPKSCVKMNPTRHPNQQTSPNVQNPVVQKKQLPKLLKESNMSGDTKGGASITGGHIRLYPELHPSNTSTDTREINVIGRRKRVENQNILQQSTTPRSRIPRLKRAPHHNTSSESVVQQLRCYQVIPHRRRRVIGQDVNKQSSDVIDGTVAFPSSASDIELLRMERFRRHNIHGHASDSTVQKLLYGAEVLGTTRTDKTQSTPSSSDMDRIDSGVGDIELYVDCTVQQYVKSYPQITQSPMLDIFTSSNSRAVDLHVQHDDSETDLHTQLPINLLLHRAVVYPLTKQINLVNESIYNYFLVQLDLSSHLSVLRRWLLLEDGEFAQSLSDQLFEKLSTNTRPCQPSTLLNPTTLNSIVQRALQYSSHRDTHNNNNVSFILRYLPKILETNKVSCLNCLTLYYRVPWPLNIVVTETCLTKYGRLFSFMLQLRHGVWALKDTGLRLKRDVRVVCAVERCDARVPGQTMHLDAHDHDQVRQLHLFRHEMQHFVMSLQSYLAHQVIEASWHRLNVDIRDNCKDLDDIIAKHQSYINTCVLKCFLNKKAERIMKVIENLLNLVLKFRVTLMSERWEIDRQKKRLIHPAFCKLTTIYENFQKHSHFMFTVLRKLTEKNYESHFEEILQQLNYNFYYQSTEL